MNMDWNDPAQRLALVDRIRLEDENHDAFLEVREEVQSHSNIVDDDIIHADKHKTRDGLEAQLIATIDVQPQYCCEALVVGPNVHCYALGRETAIIAPLGIDVHSVEMNPDQLRRLAQWALGCADFLDAIKRANATRRK
jgi:hypothetical protein